VVLKKVSKLKGKVSKESKASGGKEMLEVRGYGKRITSKEGEGKKGKEGERKNLPQ
jgi:hypothetical protein